MKWVINYTVPHGQSSKIYIVVSDAIVTVVYAKCYKIIVNYLNLYNQWF